MKKTVTVAISAFALEVLVGDDRKGAGNLSEAMVRAIRSYLNDRDSGRAGWSYPSFLRDRKKAKGVALELSVDDDLWRAFEAEARRQGVSTRQLAEHAALYFAAEENAGRITERILDNLEGIDS